MKNKFKQPVIVFVLLCILSMFYGCTDKLDKESVIKHSNSIYTSIKVIVTDKSVAPLISEEARSKLLIAEEQYLTSVRVLKKVDINSDQGLVSLDSILMASDVIIELLEVIDLPDEYDDKIAAIRVVLKVMRIQLE